LETWLVSWSDFSEKFCEVLRVVIVIE